MGALAMAEGVAPGARAGGASGIALRAFTAAAPKIYAYSTPEIARHAGWLKIGYTERDVATRIREQTHTADVAAKLEWSEDAFFFDDRTVFTDGQFRAFLERQGYARDAGKDNEWMKIAADEAWSQCTAFRHNHGVLDMENPALPYRLRDEQEAFVRDTAAYFRAHEGGAFLWNAKPRFGKTLAAYDLCRRLEARNVLIVTNRPAIANSWYADYGKFLGRASGYRFVSAAAALKGEPGVLSREDFAREAAKDSSVRRIAFTSLQDLKGGVAFGGRFDKNRDLAQVAWDILIIDEAHEGVDTLKTDLAFEGVRRRWTLHLSGTPFKALANDKFPEEAIRNWTYADEQRAKRDWDPARGANPYAALPQLALFTYQMSEIVRAELEAGVEIDGERRAFAFDLNEFFLVSGGRFAHEEAVDRFLDALTTQARFPFSTPELRAEVRHTFWLLNRVDSAKALAQKLRVHPVFRDYEVVVAAGDGKTEEDADDRALEKAFNRVKKAIAGHPRTITLSVGQLTTGVTVPEWSGVLMLCSLKSPALYVQTAFRAQNPFLFRLFDKATNRMSFLRKERAYVFDFDPARTLTLFEEFANDLCAATSDGRGDAATRRDNVRELLNFFPVIGESDGEMVALDAEEVLAIPRRIRSVEVVRSGFMSNFLFQNIACVFGAPQEVLDVIRRFEPVDGKAAAAAAEAEDAGASVEVDAEGNVVVEPETVVGQAAELFGPAIYGACAEKVEKTVARTLTKAAAKGAGSDAELAALKAGFCRETVEPLLARGEEEGLFDGMRAADRKRLERQLRERAEREVELAHGRLRIASADGGEAAEDARVVFASTLAERAEEFLQEAGEQIVETKVRTERERDKRTVEEGIRDHLRGFTRTIPSFLMAYGTEETTLANFDRIVPAAVFRDLTGCSLEEFRRLRDGWEVRDATTGAMRRVAGFFDAGVFDDAVREFLRKRTELADYFDAGRTEDIFAYIPAQKTSLVFTPRRVVKRMADLLERENPGCYDDPAATFLDPYMKSGQFIAEIVTRLFRSARMQELFPDRGGRLRHIFEKQVYGCAPSEIIHRIVLRYVLGFDASRTIAVHHLVRFDALPAAKDGTLEAALDRVFA